MNQITSTQHALAYIADARDLASAIRTLEQIAKAPAPPGLSEQQAAQRVALIHLSIQILNHELKNVLGLVHHHTTKATEGGELV